MSIPTEQSQLSLPLQQPFGNPVHGRVVEHAFGDDVQEGLHVLRLVGPDDVEFSGRGPGLAVNLGHGLRRRYSK